MRPFTIVLLLALISLIGFTTSLHAADNPVTVTIDAADSRWQISRNLLGMHFVYPQKIPDDTGEWG